MLRKLLILNGIAIIAVVLNHTTYWSDIAMFWWTDRYLPVTVPDYSQWGSTTHITLLEIRGFTAAFAVPTFLFTSGFFIAYAFKGQTSNFISKVIRPRLQNLLIPYTIWSISIFLMEILLGAIFTPLQYLIMLGFGLATPAYYYVFVLVQLFLLSPILAVMARKMPRQLLVIAVLVRIAGSLSRIYFGPVLVHFNELTAGEIVFFDSNLIFFSVGLIFGFHQNAIKPWLQRYKWGLLLASLPFYFLISSEVSFLQTTIGKTDSFLSQSMFFQPLFATTLIFTFLTFDQIAIPFSSWLIELGKNSFSIYLLHQPAMKLIAKVIYHVAPDILRNQFLFQAVLCASTLSIAMLFTRMVSRSPARSAYRYLFG